MNLVRFMLAGAAVAGLAGCFSAMDSFRNYGMPRASFEMHCPTEQLKVTVLLPCVEPKNKPVMVTLVPTAPEEGERLEMLGMLAVPTL